MSTLSRDERFEAAIQIALEASASSARRSFAYEMKRKARQFMRNLWMMDRLHPQLSLANARQFRAITDHLREGGEVSSFNIAALYLIARFMRRFERSEMRRAS